MAYHKPLPQIDNWNRPFWEAAHRQQLNLPVCKACGHASFPPGPICPNCQSDDLEWRPASGRATVESWVVFHQRYFDGFKDELPYNATLVQLEEGPFLITNILGIDNADLRLGLEVEVVFEKATDDITIPRFKPRLPNGGAV